MPPIPAPALIVVQAPRALGVRVERLEGPAAERPLAQPTPRRVRQQVAPIPLAVTAVAGSRALAAPPPLWSRADAVLSRRAWPTTRGPGHPHRRALFAQDDGAVLAPGDGRPAVLGPGAQDGLGRRQRCRARLLGLAAPKGAAEPHHVGHGTVVEAWHEEGVVAGVGAHGGPRDAPGARLIHPRPLRLGLQRDVRRASHLGAAGARSGPGRRQREPGRHGPVHGGPARRLSGDLVGWDNALAMGALAQRPSIRAGNADGTAPWLGQPGVVQSQQAVWRTRRHQGGPAVLVEGLGLPGRLGQHRLSACGRGAGHRRSAGVAVLPLQVREQPGEGALHALPAGRAAAQWRAGRQRGSELWQGIGTGLRDHGRCHTEDYSFNSAKGE
jgi:hypothetical protein